MLSDNRLKKLMTTIKANLESLLCKYVRDMNPGVTWPSATGRQQIHRDSQSQWVCSRSTMQHCLQTVPCGYVLIVTELVKTVFLHNRPICLYRVSWTSGPVGNIAHPPHTTGTESSLISATKFSLTKVQVTFITGQDHHEHACRAFFMKL